MNQIILIDVYFRAVLLENLLKHYWKIIRIYYLINKEILLLFKRYSIVLIINYSMLILIMKFLVLGLKKIIKL
jgi:hypothetical protein